MTMTERRFWGSTLAVILAAAAMGGCAREIESDPATRDETLSRISLSSTTPSATTESRYNTYLYSERDVDVYSRLVGIAFLERGSVVKAIHREIGDWVKAGQLLATLEDDEAAIAVEAAEAKADEARANFERVKVLRDRDIVSAADYDAALYGMRYAEAALKRAQLELSRTQIRAPFSGVVAKRYVRVRELVEDETPLFRITAMRPLRARLLVPESQAVGFHVGAPVRLTGTNGQSAIARVLLLGYTIDPGSGTREVILELAEAEGFRPGSAVAAELVPPKELGK